ncbi:hypothetical protein LFL96_25950 [Paraburkholderia sp. D15]|uniref:hypothetical protein n=1 Tax=Paraburkholderia sp. D15 TaxID=2880218 RepID=UPI0024792840|nr:hypothetical protein [Paraburkholderia sp. D15]WGS54460.1 hypothetical protein LFL96_25950 [Paraburkholderia sp. D15]
MKLEKNLRPEIDAVEFFKQQPKRKPNRTLPFAVAITMIAGALILFNSTRTVEPYSRSVVSARGVAYDLTHPSTLAAELIHMDSLPTASACDYFCQRDQLIEDSHKLVWSYGQSGLSKEQFEERKKILMRRYDKLEGQT